MALSSDEFTLFNETESSQDDFPLSALECYCAAAIIIFFCISLSGNSFLMWVLRKEQAWKITPDILLLQLTISNLCITVTLPFEACNLLRSWIFGEWACGFMTAVYYLGLYASILILTVMSLHYYFSFVQVSRLCAQVSRKCGVLITSILVWLVCAAASIKQFMYTEVIFEVQLCLFEWTQARVYTEFCLFFPHSFPYHYILSCPHVDNDETGQDKQAATAFKSDFRDNFWDFSLFDSSARPRLCNVTYNLGFCETRTCSDGSIALFLVYPLSSVSVLLLP